MPAVTMSMTMEVVAAAAVVVAAAGVEEDRGGRRGTTVEKVGHSFSNASPSAAPSGSKRLWAHIKPVRSQENHENESSYQGFSLGLFFFFFFS